MTADDVQAPDKGKRRISGREVRVQFDGPIKVLESFGVAGLGVLIHVPKAALIPVPGVQRFRRFQSRTLAFDIGEFRLDRSGDCARDLVLQREDVLEVAVISLCPEVLTGLGRDQLGGHANSFADLPHTALDHVSDAEIAPHLLGPDGLSFVCEGGVAGDHPKRPEARQLGDDVFGYAVGEILLVRVSRQIGEWKDDNRGLVGDLLYGPARLRNLSGREDGAIGPDRLRETLDALFAPVLESDPVLFLTCW